MTLRMTITALCVAALTAALAAPAAAADPSGQEYLPKVPSSGQEVLRRGALRRHERRRRHDDDALVLLVLIDASKGQDNDNEKPATGKTGQGEKTDTTSVVPVSSTTTIRAAPRQR